MKYQKKISVGNYLKKGVDFKDGDLLIICNEGKEIQGEFGVQNMFMVKTSEGKEGNVSFNQTTINGLIDAYGEESSNWKDRTVKATKIKQNVAGKFIDVWYYSHPNAELTENGFILTEEIPVVEDAKKSTVKKAKVDEDVIDVKDIPF